MRAIRDALSAANGLRDGDSNFDGVVDIADFSRLAQNYLGAGKKWSTGDFTFDGIVDIADFSALAQNYLGTSSGLLTEAAGEDWYLNSPLAFRQDFNTAFAEVPEPGRSAWSRPGRSGSWQAGGGGGPGPDRTAVGTGGRPTVRPDGERTTLGPLAGSDGSRRGGTVPPRRGRQRSKELGKMHLVKLAAVALVGSAILAPAAARADIIVTSQRDNHGSNAAQDVVRFFAQNVPGAQSTGTRLQAFETTLSVPTLAGPLVFDGSQDLDFDGVNDVNILGAGIQPTAPSPAGSFIRIGTLANLASTNVLARLPENRSDPDGDTVPNNVPAATYTGLRSFRVDGGFLSNAPLANAAPVLIGLAVVADGTPVTAAGRLGGETGSLQTFNLTNVPEPGAVAVAGLAAGGLLARRGRAGGRRPARR
jgi:hypothetical protein